MEPPPATASLPPSDGGIPARVGGYRVLHRIATGGTSDVLLARAEGPHGFARVVVLKLLLPEFRHDERLERMFATEAAAYARLSHPAIVKLYDFFSDAGQLVMVLEYIDGVALHKLRALLRADGTRLDDRASLFVAARVFGALSAAHAARDPQSGEFAPVIHRDVNPSNILIPWDGHAKIADFGIAKVAGVDGDRTQAGLVKGTYGYMAPEQARGEPVSVAADVYAASLLVWELLAGRKAIIRGAGSDLDVIRAMAEPTFPALSALRPDLPRPLLDAVAVGLCPDPDRRTIHAEEMVQVLRASADLEVGRQQLVEALDVVRPPSLHDDTATTVSGPIVLEPEPADATSPVTLRGSATAPAITGRPSKPAPPVRVPTIAPPRATSTLSLFSSSSRPPPPAAPSTPPAAPVAPPPSRSPPPPPPPPRPSRAPSPPAPPAPAPARTTARMTNVVTPSILAPIQPSPTPPSPPSPPPPTPSILAPAIVAAFPRPPVAPFPAAPRLSPMPPPAPWMRMPGPAPLAWTPTPAHAPAHASAPFGIEPAASPPSRRWVLAVALVVVAACIGAAVVIVARTRSTVYSPPARTTMTTAASPVTAPAPAPAPAPTPTPTPTPAPAPAPTPAPAPAPAPTPAPTPAPASGTTGTVTVAPARSGHRVWVDGRVVGESPGTFTVRCGWHAVRVGSQGSLLNLEVPCGGDVTVP